MFLKDMGRTSDDSNKVGAFGHGHGKDASRSVRTTVSWLQICHGLLTKATVSCRILIAAGHQMERVISLPAQAKTVIIWSDSLQNTMHGRHSQPFITFYNLYIVHACCIYVFRQLG